MRYARRVAYSARSAASEELASDVLKNLEGRRRISEGRAHKRVVISFSWRSVPAPEGQRYARAASTVAGGDARRGSATRTGISRRSPRGATGAASVVARRRDGHIQARPAARGRQTHQPSPVVRLPGRRVRPVRRGTGPVRSGRADQLDVQGADLRAGKGEGLRGAAATTGVRLGPGRSRRPGAPDGRGRPPEVPGPGADPPQVGPHQGRDAQNLLHRPMPHPVPEPLPDVARRGDGARTAPQPERDRSRPGHRPFKR